MVHNAGQACTEFGSGNALILSLVREHGSGRDITNRIDAGHFGLEIMADLDLPARVERDARLVEPADGREMRQLGILKAGENRLAAEFVGSTGDDHPLAAILYLSNLWLLSRIFCLPAHI